MNLLGIHLTILIGPTVAVPAPPQLLEALERVEVTHTDQGRSGFQITFKAGRSGPTDRMDYPLLSMPQLRVFNRVILVVTFNAIPRVLMDGIITNQQLAPSNEPGATTLTVTGEDVSVMMDREEKTEEHPAQDDAVVALKLIGYYAQYGLQPDVIPPPTVDSPVPTERVPVQQGTDLAHLQALAKRHGYVFYVRPGPAPATNIAYWGPPVRTEFPQKALTVNMGPDTNVESISFQYNALSATRVTGTVQDRTTNEQVPIETVASLRFPLASQPDWIANAANLRVKILRQSGPTTTQALALAQGIMDKSMDNVVTASGELDMLRYGDLLQARGVVGLRGCGFNHDGNYYVKSVTHSLRQGEYKQRFSLTREGMGALLPVVRVV